MRGQEGKKKKKKSKPAIPRDDRVLREVRRLVDGCTVRVSEPNRFFARKWKAMLPLVSEQVKASDRGFELHAAFCRSFEESLELLLKLRKLWWEQYADYRASDLVADALCSAVEDIFSNIGLHRVPLHLPFKEVFEYVDTTANSPSSNQEQRRNISIAISKVHRESDNLPELSISIAGEPVNTLIAFNMMSDDSANKETAQMQAERIWDTVIKRLAVRLGIRRPGRGKPGGDLGYYAAWEHDHGGWSWAKIAKAECKQQHQHTADSCERNFRKLAQQFYLKQEKEYLKIASARENKEHKPVT